MTYRSLPLVCALLLLGACGKNEEQPAPKLFKEQRDVLDKAKAVDGTQQQQDAAQKKAIEQQAQ